MYIAAPTVQLVTELRSALHGASATRFASLVRRAQLGTPLATLARTQVTELRSAQFSSTPHRSSSALGTAELHLCLFRCAANCLTTSNHQPAPPIISRDSPVYSRCFCFKTLILLRNSLFFGCFFVARKLAPKNRDVAPLNAYFTV
jgi:hypothetical protein